MFLGTGTHFSYQKLNFVLKLKMQFFSLLLNILANGQFVGVRMPNRRDRPRVVSNGKYHNIFLNYVQLHTEIDLNLQKCV